MAFCPDGYTRLERLRLFFERRVRDRIFAFIYPPSAVLRAFRETHKDIARGPTSAGRAAFWERLPEERG